MMSHRAKQNMTRQLKAQLKFLQENLRGREKAVKNIRKYARYKLPGYKRTLAQHLSGIKSAKKKISDVKVRILKRQRLGQIYRIL